MALTEKVLSCRALHSVRKKGVDMCHGLMSICLWRYLRKIMSGIIVIMSGIIVIISVILNRTFRHWYFSHGFRKSMT